MPVKKHRSSAHHQVICLSLVGRIVIPSHEVQKSPRWNFRCLFCEIDSLLGFNKSTGIAEKILFHFRVCRFNGFWVPEKQSIDLNQWLYSIFA